MLRSNLPPSLPPEIAVAGDSEFATITHLAWHHASRFLDYDSSLDRGQRLASLLREFSRLEAEDCFCEGVVLGRERDCGVPPKPYESLTLGKAFPDRTVPENLSEFQSFTLGTSDYEVALVYFFPNVRILACERNQVSVEKHRVTADEYNTQVFTDRQRFAMECVYNHITRTPKGNKNVALFFGAGHKFSQADLPLNLPRTPLVRRIGFVQWCGYRLGSSIKEALSEEAQLNLIADHPMRISSHCWEYAKSTRVQAALLPRLRMYLTEVITPEALAAKLLNGAVRDKGGATIASAIEAAFDARTGPFSDLCDRTQCSSALDIDRNVDPLDICNERHPYTQLQLIKLVRRIPYWVYLHLRCPPAQREALPNLERDTQVSLDEFRAYLIRNSWHESVLSEIQRRFDAAEPPFKEIF